MTGFLYEKLLCPHSPDISYLGIGISGHCAFTEPEQSFFDDPQRVRIINVSEASKKQLLEDPNFQRLGFIPTEPLL